MKINPATEDIVNSSGDPKVVDESQRCAILKKIFNTVGVILLVITLTFAIWREATSQPELARLRKQETNFIEEKMAFEELLNITRTGMLDYELKIHRDEVVLHNLMAELEEIKQTAIEKNKKDDLLSEAIEKERQSLQKMVEEVEPLRQTLKNALKKLDVATSQNAQLKLANGEISERLSNFKSKKDDSAKNAANLEMRVSDLLNDKESLEKNINELEERLAASVGNNESLLKNIAEMKILNKNLVDQVVELTDINTKLGEDKIKLTEINSKVTSYNSKLDEDFNKMVFLKEKLEQNITSLISEIDILQEQLRADEATAPYGTTTEAPVITTTEQTISFLSKSFSAPKTPTIKTEDNFRDIKLNITKT